MWKTGEQVNLIPWNPRVLADLFWKTRISIRNTPPIWRRGKSRSQWKPGCFDCLVTIVGWFVWYEGVGAMWTWRGVGDVICLCSFNVNSHRIGIENQNRLHCGWKLIVNHLNFVTLPGKFKCYCCECFFSDSPPPQCFVCLNTIRKWSYDTHTITHTSQTGHSACHKCLCSGKNLLTPNRNPTYKNGTISLISLC